MSAVAGGASAVAVRTIENRTATNNLVGERGDLLVGMEGIVSGAKRRGADSHRHGLAAVLALIGISMFQEHGGRGTRSVTASSTAEDLPNNSYMRHRRELGGSTLEAAKAGMSAGPDARAGEEATLRVEDKRAKRANGNRHATKRLRDGSTLGRPIDSATPVEQSREEASAERTRLNLAPFAAAAGLAAIVALIATNVDWAQYSIAIALGVLA